MARIKLTLSANAGGALQLGEYRILIDALHEGKMPGFSTLDHKLQEAVLSHPDFTDPDWICVTHDHPDHCSARLLDKATGLWPEAKVFLPKDGLQQGTEPLRITYLPLVHEGKEYASVPNYGILLHWLGKTILISGDCMVADEGLLEHLDGITIDLAILNFPWLTLRKGRTCLQNRMKPRKAIFWHLPFAEDDVNGYRRSAEMALGEYPAQLLYDPLQSIEIDI